jgi:hypothetical protein
MQAICQRGRRSPIFRYGFEELVLAFGMRADETGGWVQSGLRLIPLGGFDLAETAHSTQGVPFAGVWASSQAGLSALKCSALSP